MEMVIPSLLNKSEKFLRVGFKGIHCMGRAMIAPEFLKEVDSIQKKGSKVTTDSKTAIKWYKTPDADLRLIVHPLSLQHVLKYGKAKNNNK